MRFSLYLYLDLVLFGAFPFLEVASAGDQRRRLLRVTSGLRVFKQLRAFFLKDPKSKIL